MHQSGAPRKAVAARQSVAAHPLAFAALVVANVALAFGPWFVRLADVGPVAAGFWRIALAVPFLLGAGAGERLAAGAAGRGRVDRARARRAVLRRRSRRAGISASCSTTLANATLFGNSATLFFPIYGFLVARAWPTRTQGFALLLALIGAALLMGRSYPARRRAISPATCSACSRACSTRSISSLMARARDDDGAAARAGAVDAGERRCRCCSSRWRWASR